MSTPDDLAAAVSAPLWDDGPLPPLGRRIGLKHQVTQIGRTRWETVTGVVTAAQQFSDTGLIITLDSGKSYLLRSDSLLDGWWFTDTDPTVPFEGDIPPVTVDAEHENRLATDPVYRHHWETHIEQIGLSQLRAELDDETNPFGPDLSSEPEQNIADGLPDPHGETLAARMRRLEWLEDRMKALNAEAEGFKTEYDQLCATTLEQMAQEGVPSITVDGNTWFMRPRSYVEKIDGATPEDIREALIESGLGSMLTTNYNSNSLRSLLVEFRDSDGKISVPDKLAAVVRLAESITLGRTRAASSRRRKRTSPSP